MTTHWTDRLSEYLDGELPGADHEACRAHLEQCEPCRTVFEEIRAVSRAAAAWHDAPPQRDLWAGIQARIAAPAVLPFRPREPRRVRLSTAIAAGLALLLAGGGTAWVALRAPGAAAPAPAVASTPAPDAVVLPASTRAEQTYDAAIRDLRAVLQEGRARLDPQTVLVLERNLAVVDSAIADAERAVASDPANAYLTDYLARTMRRKLDLLRHAAVLAAART